MCDSHISREGQERVPHKRLAAYLALPALAAVFVLLAACVPPSSLGKAANVVSGQAHPAFDASKPCSTPECHEGEKQHLPPYTGDCKTCHAPQSWSIITYKHANDDFNTALHGTIGCAPCHKAEGIAPPSPACSSCHKAPHSGWSDCKQCHTPLTWLLRRPTPARHVSLQGGHQELSCIDCHNAPTQPASARTCASCHGVKHGGLVDCQRCHDPARGWAPGKIDHNAFFTLSGVHKTLKCTRCHPDTRFKGTSPKCVSCHGAKHGGLTRCAACHTTSRFKPASLFNHSRHFSLTGPHRRVSCSRCHPSRQFARVRGTTCLGCHGPQHGGLTSCRQCHTANGSFGRFDHATFFPLVGAHSKLACSKCHGTGGFKKAPGKACVDCHGVKHGNQTACGTCHTTTTFKPAKAITHPSPVTLGAKHASMSCTLCHPTLTFSAPTKPCQDCHVADVPHVGPTDCGRCHRPTTWGDWHERFVHPPITVPGNIHDINGFDSCLDACHEGDFTRYTCTRCH